MNCWTWYVYELVIHFMVHYLTGQSLRTDVPMSSSSTSISSLISSRWRVRSWVEDPLGVCVTLPIKKKKFVD